MAEPEIIAIVPTSDNAHIQNSPTSAHPSSPLPQKSEESGPPSKTDVHCRDVPPKVASQSFQQHIRNQLLDAIEELRLRRVTDVENENKTKQLVNDKHLLKNTTDELKQKIKCLENEQNDKMNGMKAKFENICKEHKAEKNKLAVNLESKEKELKNLKEEVRAMQLSKYSLEKKLEEMERKHHVHSSINENKLVQADKLEETTQSLAKKFAQLVEHQERLARNVKESARLHDKLLYVNNHKECELRLLKAEVDRLKKELADCHVKLHSQKAQEKQQLQDEVAKNSFLARQIKLMENELEQTKKQAQDYLQDKEINLQALKESHELLEKQVVLCNKNNAKAADLEEQLKDMNAQFNDLKQKYDDKAMELEIEKAVSQKDCEEWKEKEESLQQKVTELEEKQAGLSKSLSELDALNSKWSQKNAELAEKTKELQAFIDRPRVDAEMQSEYLMETVYVQTENVSENTSTQTDRAEVTVHTQTEQYCDVKQCQTDELKCVNTKVQTEEVMQCHFQVQVDMEPQVGLGVKVDIEAPLSSSQPVLCQSSLEVEIDTVSSSQPSSSSTTFDGSPTRSILHDGSGDYVELSPYSRFQETLKKLGTVTKRRSEGEGGETEAKRTKQTVVTSLHSPRNRSSFQLVDDAERCQDDVIPPTQGVDLEAGPVGILQNQGIKKRAAKKVTFSSQLEEKKEFVVVKSVDPMSLEDEDEISLFSDEESDKFEISTQVLSVETILKKDRLKTKKST